MKNRGGKGKRGGKTRKSHQPYAKRCDDENLDTTSIPSELEPTPDEQSTGPLRAIEAATVTVLMYASLLKLFAPFITWGKQWLDRYLQNAVGSVAKCCGDRQPKHHGLELKRPHPFTEIIWAMLHVVLFLLTHGLYRRLRSVNTSGPYILIALTVFGKFSYTVTAIACTLAASHSLWKETRYRFITASLSVVIGSLDLVRVLSANTVRLWGIARCSAISAVLRFKQTIMLMALDLNQWVRQAARRPPPQVPPNEETSTPQETNTFSQESISGASLGQDYDYSLESLKRRLSSGSQQQPLDLEIIDVLEQGLREDSPLSASDQKRLSMILKKICYEHQRLPPSYTITGKLDRTGEYPIGGGRNADVWRGVYRGSQVAIKVLRVNVGTDLVNLERKFCREVVIWKQFKHPNLLPLIGTKKASQTLMMISEWMEYGTIMQFINARPETNRLKLLADISRGLRYLHEWPSVHADLKSSNILIDSNHSARIADFGLTSLLRHPSISMSVSAPVWGGTIQWMAPELFHEDSRPSKESDIYALGMVIYELFAHEHPFPHVFQFLVPVLVLAGERPPRPTNRGILGLSEEVWALIEQCWDRTPSDRPHIADILVLFEAASRDWVSPTPEAIANLNLGRSTRRLPLITESADTTSGFI